LPVNNTNLFFTRSDTYTFTVQAQTYSQSVINLTGVISIICKGRLDPLDATPVFTKSLTLGGVVVTNATAGLFTVTIAPQDTINLPDYPLSMYYDVKVTDSSGNATTVQGGKIYISPVISY
jgi:hypothetical protein